MTTWDSNHGSNVGFTSENELMQRTINRINVKHYRIISTNTNKHLTEFNLPSQGKHSINCDKLPQKAMSA